MKITIILYTILMRNILRDCSDSNFVDERSENDNDVMNTKNNRPVHTSQLRISSSFYHAATPLQKKKNNSMAASLVITKSGIHLRSISASLGLNRNFSSQRVSLSPKLTAMTSSLLPQIQIKSTPVLYSPKQFSSSITSTKSASSNTPINTVNKNLLTPFMFMNYTKSHTRQLETMFSPNISVSIFTTRLTSIMTLDTSRLYSSSNVDVNATVFHSSMFSKNAKTTEKIGLIRDFTSSSPTVLSTNHKGILATDVTTLGYTASFPFKYLSTITNETLNTGMPTVSYTASSSFVILPTNHKEILATDVKTLGYTASFPFKYLSTITNETLNTGMPTVSYTASSSFVILPTNHKEILATDVTTLGYTASFPFKYLSTITNETLNTVMPNVSYTASSSFVILSTNHKEILATDVTTLGYTASFPFKYLSTITNETLNTVMPNVSYTASSSFVILSTNHKEILATVDYTASVACETLCTNHNKTMKNATSTVKASWTMTEMSTPSFQERSNLTKFSFKTLSGSEMTSTSYSSVAVYTANSRNETEKLVIEQPTGTSSLTFKPPTMVSEILPRVTQTLTPTNTTTVHTETSPSLKYLFSSLQSSSDDQFAVGFRIPFDLKRIKRIVILVQEYEQTLSDLSHRISTWYHVMHEKHCRYCRYRAISRNSNELLAHREKRSINLHFEHIGSALMCEQKPDDQICNGPLKPGTAYRLQIEAYLNDDSVQHSPFTTPHLTHTSHKIVENDSRETTVIVLAVLLVSFVLLTLIIFTVICKRRSSTRSKRPTEVRSRSRYESTSTSLKKARI